MVDLFFRLFFTPFYDKYLKGKKLCVVGLGQAGQSVLSLLDLLGSAPVLCLDDSIKQTQHCSEVQKIAGSSLDGIDTVIFTIRNRGLSDKVSAQCVSAGAEFINIHDINKLSKLIILYSNRDILLPVLILLPLAPLVRFVSYVFNIRYTRLYTERLGHMASNMDIYLSYMNMGEGTETLDLMYLEDVPANQQLYDMWVRTGGLRISSFYRVLSYVNMFMQGYERYAGDFRHFRPHDITGRVHLMPVNIEFNDKETSYGLSLLKKLGIGDEQIICFHNRDSSYLEQALPEFDFKYHDYRDSSVRNYEESMLHFAERGFKCVRLGSVTKEPLTVEHPNIIDYSRSVLQSDFMDIFLIHRAKFIVCSATGIGDAAGALRKSIVYVNFVPMLRHLPQILSRRSIFLPKYVYSEERGRNLTLREIQEGGSFLKSEKYSDEGLKCVENSSEEILSACIQMNDLLDSKYQPDDAESELQKRFWRIFDTDWEEGEDYIRVSADFLAANRGQLQ